MVKTTGGPERLASWDDFEASEREGTTTRPVLRAIGPGSARARLYDTPPESRDSVEALTSGVDLVEELEAILRQGFVEPPAPPMPALQPGPPAPAAQERLAFIPSTAPVEEPLPAAHAIATMPLPAFLHPEARDAALVRPAVPPPGPVDEAAALAWEDHRPRIVRRGFRADLAIAAILLLGVLGASGFAFLRSTTPPAATTDAGTAETPLAADPPAPAGDEVVLLGGAAVPPAGEQDLQLSPVGDSGATAPVDLPPPADAADQSVVTGDEAAKVEDRVPADPALTPPADTSQLPTFVTQVPDPAASAPAAPPADPIATEVPSPAVQNPPADPPAATPPAGAGAPAGVAEVTTWVNMRSGPDNGAGVVTVVPAGAEVLVTGCNLWCEVMYEGRAGYIFQDFLRR